MVYLAFWGKARPSQEGGVRWHPAAYHCLDVAACCELLLKRFPRFAKQFASAAGVTVREAERFIVMLVALHDIGKLSIGFQAKVPELYPDILGPKLSKAPRGDHTAIGQALLDQYLRNEMRTVAPGMKWAWPPLISAISGHHGRPVSEPEGEPSIGVQAIAAAREFLLDVQSLFGFGEFSAQLNGNDAKSLSWQLAGLTTLADWIGSNQQVFSYESPEWGLEAYWNRIARPRAELALRQSGLTPVAISGFSGFKALTKSDYEPSPLQVYAERVAFPDAGPLLFLIEDMTGAGKTEAALILAHRLMQSGRADGLFVALPTMATANAMYDRLKDIYRRLFTEDAQPSLVLAHGARNLHEGFTDSILDIGEEERDYDDRGDVTSSAACAAWIADDRRKAFFAHVGVGTIDQALLGVLPSKFAPLRLYGLSNRILIIDEAHSYDPYMREEMECLVRFHVAQGGSAIILSATLPQTMKNGLVDAFRLGQGYAVKPHTWSQSYPLATMVTFEGEVMSKPLATRADLPRSVPVRRQVDQEEAHAAILRAAAAGAAVGYIRNTVDDAQASYEYLKAQGGDVALFHARFAMADRLAIEKYVLMLVGKHSNADGRRGKIIVATQVIESSLDIDFDLLVTDLAPIDLLIQRAGRLWRHARKERPLAGPELMIVSPEPVSDARPDWYKEKFPNAGIVYKDHALLWKTARTIFDEGKLVSPESVRSLVESVYGGEALDDIPEGLAGRREEADGGRKAEKSIAANNLLKLDEGYVAGSGSWESEVFTPTRLGEEQTILRLARIENGVIRPWVGITPHRPEQKKQAEQRAWALSEVSVRAYKVKKRGMYDVVIERQIDALESRWRDIGDGAVIIPLLPGEEEGSFRGKGMSEKEKDCELAYSPENGLVIS